MCWGQKNRLSRIFQKDDRTVMLAVDHGYFLGPTRKLEDPRKTITPLLPYADALMLTRGVLAQCVDPDQTVPIVLRVSGGSTIIGEDLSKETITTSVKDALRWNASALALSVFVGARYEFQTISNLAKLIDEANEFGVPVLAVTAVGKELEKRDARFLSLACRVCAEMGAHFVKTYYCENFEKVVQGCPVPIVIAGGPKLETELDAFKLAYNAIQEGAQGVDFGRNIWQNDHPVAMIQAIRAIVHESAKPEQALDLYQTIIAESKS